MSLFENTLRQIEKVAKVGNLRTATFILAIKRI